MGEKLKRAGQSFVIVQYNYFGAFLLCISLVFFFAIFFLRITLLCWQRL